MSKQRSLDRLEIEIGELIETSTRDAGQEDFSGYMADPVGWVRDVLGGTPWSAQEEIMRSVIKHPLTVVRSCNAAGKDWTAAALALFWVFVRGGKVLVTGPTERQVKEVLMLNEVARAFHRAKDRLPRAELFQMALRVPGAEEDRGILAFTSTEASKISGHHASRVLVIVTEGQGVEDWAYEGLFGCAAGPEDRILVVGNPLIPAGRFYDICHSDTWHDIQISALDHPNVIEGREVIPGGVSRAFIDRMEGEYGKDSGVYQSRCLGEFPDMGEEALFSRTWLDAAAERWESGFFAKDTIDVEPILSIDPARYGPDSTVLAVRRGPVIEKLIEWRGLGTMETVARIEAEGAKLGVRPHRPASGYLPEAYGLVIVDVVGLGAGVADRVRQLGYQVQDFNAGQFATQGKKFLNTRAEAYWKLRNLLEEGKIALPRDGRLFEELLALRWSPTPDGKVRLEAKIELKNRIGRSPDKADAVMMAYGFRDTRPHWFEFYL